jgi:hypothetical protein
MAGPPRVIVAQSGGPTVVRSGHVDSSIPRRDRHRHRVEVPPRARRIQDARGLRPFPGAQGTAPPELEPAPVRSRNVGVGPVDPCASRPHRLLAGPLSQRLRGGDPRDARDARSVRDHPAGFGPPAGRRRPLRQQEGVLEAQAGAAALHRKRRAPRAPAHPVRRLRHAAGGEAGDHRHVPRGGAHRRSGDDRGAPALQGRQGEGDPLAITSCSRAPTATATIRKTTRASASGRSSTRRSGGAERS